MNQLRLYVDEDAAEQAVVDGLRNHGIDVVTVVEAGAPSASDEEQLAFAASEGRSIYSLNVRDFTRLHTALLSAGRHHAGIIVIPRQRYSVGEKIRAVSDLVAVVSAEEMVDRLEFL
jgi:hypothetical protein